MYHFIDFKNFKDAAINLFNPVTILIGPNGSGKTNLIEGIQVFSDIARGRPLHEIRDISAGNGGAVVRGGLSACPREGSSVFEFRFDRVSVQLPSGQWVPVQYRVGISVQPAPRIIRESLVIEGDRPVFRTLRKGSAETPYIKVEYDNSKKGTNPQFNAAHNRSVLSQYPQIALQKVADKKKNDYERIVDGVMRHLRATYVFDPDPKLMREYERVGDNTLSSNGKNLSAVLYDLHKNNPEALKRIGDRIRELPEEPYRGFDFAKTKYNDVIFALKRQGENKGVDAKILSDGTLRCLSVLTALETVPKGSRIIIEEFDNGVHPSRVGVLVDALMDSGKRRKLNILVTTHNPATLNALSDDLLKSVVLCTWDEKSKASILVPLPDIPRVASFLEQGRFGDLITRRVAERYLAPDLEKKQGKKFGEWLDSLP